MTNKRKRGLLKVLDSKPTVKSNHKRKSSAPKKAPSSNKPKMRETQKKDLIPVGRTLKTKDEFLPQKKSKVKKLKDRRWVAVIETHTKNELAVVRLTDENQKNSTLLPDYKKGNKKPTYFKHFVETQDNEGNPIKASKKGKFQENPAQYDLSEKEVGKIRLKIFARCKQAKTNKEKVEELKKHK